MADLNERDTKLVQYLNEAYGKEKELETALEAHIAMTSRAPYKKRLQQHLKETKSHAREVERRIKKLGGTADGIGARAAGAAGTVQSAAKKAAALSKGPLHAVRGTSEPEKELKNAKTEYSEEAEEIATYTAIETLAETVGDKDTAKLARTIRREEERMATYLAKLIPQLTKAVATAEIPASQRSTGRRRSTSSRRRSTSAASRSRSTAARSTTKRSTAARGTTKRSTSSRRTSRNGSSASSRSAGGSPSSGRSRSRSASSRSRSGTRAGSRS
jgi:ferritin-like metal-binding protein YciE